MSAAEYYNVGPDYHQQNPAPAQQGYPPQGYPQQAYPQYPQPVRSPRCSSPSSGEDHMHLRFRSPRLAPLEAVPFANVPPVLPSTTTTAASLLPPTTAHASSSVASPPGPGGRPGPATAQVGRKELLYGMPGCIMLLLRDRRGVRVLVSSSTSTTPLLLPQLP